MRFQSAKGLNVKKQFIFFALLLSISATCCSLTSGYDNWYGAGMGAMGGYGMGGWGWGGAAGGVGEIYSGMGNMVRAEGQRNLLDAQAEKTQQQAWQEHEKARTLHIENQQSCRNENANHKPRTRKTEKPHGLHVSVSRHSWTPIAHNHSQVTNLIRRPRRSTGPRRCVPLVSMNCENRSIPRYKIDRSMVRHQISAGKSLEQSVS